MRHKISLRLEEASSLWKIGHSGGRKKKVEKLFFFFPFGARDSGEFWERGRYV